MPPQPGLAREIERIHRLEAADVIGWWEAADLISQLEDGKRSLIHTLGRLPIADLQARFLQLLTPGERSVHPLSSFRLPADRDRLVAAILDRIS